MVLTEELRKSLAKKIDSLIKLPIWAEPFDTFALKMAFDFIDENYGDRVPDKFKDDLESVVKCFINDDYKGIIDCIAPLANDVIDIPGMSETNEGTMFALNIQATLKFIEYYAHKNK